MDQLKLTELKEYMVAHGFGALLEYEHQLEQRIVEDLNDFQILFSTTFDELTVLVANVYFRKSIKLDCYFVHKFTATLKYTEREDKVKVQTFYAYEHSMLTLKEAYNLLQGRYVYFNVVPNASAPYKAWLQLDFSETDPTGNYKFRRYTTANGFDLEKTLDMYPIEELKNENTRRGMIISLKKGNLHLVTFKRGHKMEKKLIEANPRDKRINIYLPFSVHS